MRRGTYFMRDETMTMIDTHIENTTGRIILRREKALNALNAEMCADMEQALRAWRENPDVTQVIIEGEGEKAFCAGGDVAELYHIGERGDFDYAQKYWKDEYRLNQLIADYPKPFIAFMHGFVMGGGVGVSGHAGLRVVCETTQAAMPECAIGLIPDVGGSALLALAPRRVGNFLGVTGYRMNAEDAIYAGFADIFVPRNKWPELKAQLIKDGTPIHAKDFATPPSVTGKLGGWQGHIDDLFAADELNMAGFSEEILGGVPDELARSIQKSMGYNAPLSMKAITEILRRLREGKITVAAALDLEYRFSARCMREGDFLEGVRAMLIDKDKTPQWKHENLDAVSREKVNSMLEVIDA